MVQRVRNDVRFKARTAFSRMRRSKRRPYGSVVYGACDAFPRREATCTSRYDIRTAVLFKVLYCSIKGKPPQRREQGSADGISSGVHTPGDSQTAESVTTDTGIEHPSHRGKIELSSAVGKSNAHDTKFAQGKNTQRRAKKKMSIESTVVSAVTLARQAPARPSGIAQQEPTGSALGDGKTITANGKQFHTCTVAVVSSTILPFSSHR